MCSGHAKIKRIDYTMQIHRRSAAVAPNRSLVAGNRDGEKCSRAVIEPGTASDGIRGKLSFVGALWVPEVRQKRRHRSHHHGGRQLPNRLTVSGVPSQGDGQGESQRSNLDALALCLSRVPTVGPQMTESR